MFPLPGHSPPQIIPKSTYWNSSSMFDLTNLRSNRPEKNKKQTREIGSVRSLQPNSSPHDVQRGFKK